MTLPSVSSSPSIISTDLEIPILEESLIHSPNSKSENSNALETAKITLLSNQPPTESSDPSIHQPFIQDFVTSFLHPYITGQITCDNEPANRKSVVELLLEKMPTFKPSQREAIIELAFQAYLKASALGLYVNRMIIEEVITPNTAEFELWVRALEISIPKDFPEKKMSFQVIEILAEDALLTVSEEKIRLNEESKKHDYEISYGQWLKFNFLKQSGDLFLSGPCPLSMLQTSLVDQIEQNLLDILKESTSEKIETFKQELALLESQNTLDALNTQGVLSKKVGIWKTLFELLKTFTKLKAPLYGNHSNDLNLIQKDLADRYQGYLEKTERDDLALINFMNSELNTFNLIEKVTIIKVLLDHIGIKSGLLNLYMETTEEVYWNTAVFSTSFEDPGDMHSTRQNSLERYNLLIEVLHRILQYSKYFEKHRLLMDNIIDLLEECICCNDIPNNKIIEKFRVFFPSKFYVPVPEFSLLVPTS